MSVSTFSALLAKLRAPTQVFRTIKSAQVATGSHLNSEWTSAGDPAAGTVPGTTAATCTRTTTGAIGQRNKVGSEQRAWLRSYASGGGAASLSGYLVLVDRLAHVGGLSGAVATAQTVGFPALTRYTSGVDVWAAAEIYTAIGATGTTATISYTNTVPTAGKVSPAIAIGATGFNAARSVFPFGYASGDVGVTAVASITLAATTGTVGNLGVSLFKTLAAWPINNQIPWPLRGDPMYTPGGMPPVQDDACLQLLHFGGGQVSTILIADLCMFED